MMSDETKLYIIKRCLQIGRTATGPVSWYLDHYVFPSVLAGCQLSSLPTRKTLLGKKLRQDKEVWTMLESLPKPPSVLKCEVCEQAVKIDQWGRFNHIDGEPTDKHKAWPQTPKVEPRYD